MRNVFLFFVSFCLFSIPGLGTPIRVDPEMPYIVSPPLPLPVLFQFRTSDSGYSWTAEQKQAARDSISYLGTWFLDQPAFSEEASPDDFSIRWEGPAFFKDWGEHGGWDLNFAGALAVAAKNQIGGDAPWDRNRYPLGEIYFNTAYPWHYNPLTQPGAGEYDFPSILLHETIHMLCVNQHAAHQNEVMYYAFAAGERRWTLQESDLQLLRDAGYRMIPEPNPGILFGSALLVLLVLRRWTLAPRRHMPRRVPDLPRLRRRGANLSA
ncbi:MAG: hypothetical protein HY821_22995 [Acidobacteria bacterium]|nr:hypothetical protein [Acidobacteriota bacterium]